MREKVQTSHHTFVLIADAAEIHRHVQMDRRDWHLFGCQVAPRGRLRPHCRIASALRRLSHDLVGHLAETWHMIMADDCHLEACGGGIESEHMMLFVLRSAVGVHLCSIKTAGGVIICWVGFEL